MRALMSIKKMQKLHQNTYGDINDSPIVFLHGFLGRGADWLPTIEFLKHQYYCITIDLPGHGRSIGLREEFYSFKYTVNFISNLIVSNAKPVILIGYSMGSRIALAIAMNQKNISHLVLESVNPGLETIDEKNRRQLNDAKWAKMIGDVDLYQFLQKWYHQPIFTNLGTDKALLADALKRRSENNSYELAKAMQAFSLAKQKSYWNELSNLPDTCLITGGNDVKFSALAKLMCVKNNLLKHSIVSNLGHNVHLENAKEFAKIVLNFLNIDSSSSKV